MPQTPLQALVNAIYTHFNGDQSAGTVYAVTSGRLFFARHPAQVDSGSQLEYPFVVFELTGRSDWDCFSVDGEEVRVQFTAVSDLPSGGTRKVLEIMDLLKDRFENNQMTFPATYGTFNLVEMVAGTIQGPFYADKDSVGLINFTVKYTD